jgi:NAD(P)-dependent dehydrogenase (short-subunit alcohol dehydrogenase family)
MDLGLQDKVALVTGSSRGLGLASAKALAADGARVLLTARGVEQLARAATGHRVPAPPFDNRRGSGHRRRRQARRYGDAVDAFGGSTSLNSKLGLGRGADSRHQRRQWAGLRST